MGGCLDAFRCPAWSLSNIDSAVDAKDDDRDDDQNITEHMRESKLLNLAYIYKWEVKTKSNEEPPPFADDATIRAVFGISIV